jgi:hypothetical protein
MKLVLNSLHFCVSSAGPLEDLRAGRLAMSYSAAWQADRSSAPPILYNLTNAVSTHMVQRYKDPATRLISCYEGLTYFFFPTATRLRLGEILQVFRFVPF